MMGKSETLQDKLQTFNRTFNHPIGLRYPLPSAMVDGEKNLRRSLIQEEFKELMYAISNEEDDEVLKELCDLSLTVGLLILRSIEYMSRTCLSWMQKAIQSTEKMVKWLSLTAINHRNLWT